MALWCSLGDQLQSLPVTTAAPVFGTDEVLVITGLRSFACNSDLRDLPFTLVFAFDCGTNAVTDATNPKERVGMPYNATAFTLRAATTSTHGAGTAPGFDVYNITDALSLVDNTSGPNSVLFPASGSVNTSIDTAPDRPQMDSQDTVGAFVTQGGSLIRYFVFMDYSL